MEKECSEGYRILICYPSHILMQPLRSKKRLLIRSFYGEFAKKDDTARGSAVMIKILWISPSIMHAIQCKTHRNALRTPAKLPPGFAADWLTHFQQRAVWIEMNWLVNTLKACTSYALHICTLKRLSRGKSSASRAAEGLNRSRFSGFTTGAVKKV